jgi:hypothetical protein
LNSCFTLSPHGFAGTGWLERSNGLHRGCGAGLAGATAFMAQQPVWRLRLRSRGRNFGLGRLYRADFEATAGAFFFTAVVIATFLFLRASNARAYDGLPAVPVSPSRDRNMPTRARARVDFGEMENLPLLRTVLAGSLGRFVRRD